MPRSAKHSRRVVAALPRLFVLLTAILPPACAPSAEPLAGDIGDQVQAALDSGRKSFDHSLWDGLLAAGTAEGLLDYDYFRAHRADLDRYVETLAGARLAELSRDHLMALLINAYNAYTVVSILDHPGVASIREIEGVWSETKHALGGFMVTLDNIEHNLLRPYFKDPRVHVAVNCASWSCAPLPPWAFTGEALNDQLERWTGDFFKDPKYCRREGDQLLVSSLLDWYGGDFTKPDASPRADTLAEFIARYTTAEIRAWLEQPDNAGRIGFLEYDWRLNQAP